MLRDARLVARKDLRIELVSKVIAGQIVPFGLIVLLLFGLAVSPDLAVLGRDGRSVLAQVAPGLFWVAVVLSALLAVGRSFAVEAQDGNLDALKMTGLDPAGVFLGKAAAVAVELFILELILGIGAFILYGTPIASWALLAATIVLTTAGITAAGTVYAALAAGLRVRDTLVPLLLLPVLTPVLLGASIATEAALFGPPSDGWSWVLLLGAFALLYVGVGIVAFGSIMEE